VRAQAQSGTGKTGAFVIAALQLCDESVNLTQVLVLASTREIAAQNTARCRDIGIHMKVGVVLLSGGTPIAIDQDALRMNPQIVVGTPGRVEHMIEIGALKTENIRLLIIDEADEMLKAGFQDQVRSIFRRLNKTDIQIAMFSATYGEEELRVSEDILVNPVTINLVLEDQTLKGIRQYYVAVGSKPPFRRGRGDHLIPKTVTLLDIFKKQGLGQVIVFVNSKEDARFVYTWLKDAGWPCDLTSAELTQPERENALNRLREGKSRCMVSSGVLSRGIDIPDLSVVICLDLPSEGDWNTYVHRIGRSGRYGKRGTVINIVYDDELRNLKAIEKFYSTMIKELPENFSFQ